MKTEEEIRYNVCYFDNKTNALVHTEKGYSTLHEARKDAATYLYGYNYEIKEERINV